MDEALNEDTKLKLRQLMINSKNFLKNLYLSNSLSSKEIVSFAKDFEINILIKILFFIVQGEIPVKKNHYEFLVRTKKKTFLEKKLSSKAKLNSVKF